MPRVVSFDFTGAPPEMGGGGSDHVPPGKYGVQLEEVTDGTAKSSGKRMITATFRVRKDDGYGGANVGKKLIERFVLEPESFGMKRFHAYLTIINAPGVTQGAFQLDLDTIVNTVCYVDVYEEEQKDGQYAGQKQSRIGSFYSAQATNGTAPTQAAAPAPQPVAAAVAAPPVQAPAPEAPAQVDVAAAAASVDELFK